MKDAIIQWIRSFYGTTNFNQSAYEQQAIYWAIGMFAVLIAFSLAIWYVSRGILIKVLYALVDRTKSSLDDHLVKNKVFRSLAHLVPLMFMDYFLSIVFYQFPYMHGGLSRLVSVLILFAVMVSINRGLNAFRDIIKEKEVYSDKPIQSYFQVGKIAVSGIFFIIMLSVVTSKSPIFFLTSLGAVSAILLLVFKDTILGFVGSIQLSVNDMIRIGDWVTMEKFGADGEVEEINLATVKVRNFDKTITTIPTYSFISDSFRNWRGMQESEGRRIKRSVYIQIDSIHFASEDLIKQLGKIKILNNFILEREKEIQAYNEKNGFVGDQAVNARKQTNIGLFRRYIEYYLQHNLEINQKMNLLVRQLDSSDKGVPIEVYCFTKTKVWNEYELITADIFDHIFAIVPLFELTIFESPTGKDFRN
ncbi:MAG: mechanosensitive ion channel family protein [Crocinitomicaceae bacterium]|nr:mechanosensitive ion channel family protein [Crocinitomicaceae bacterium]